MNMDVKATGNWPFRRRAFKVLNVMAVNRSQQYASVQFSDMIENDQCCSTGSSRRQREQSDISYTISGNEAKYSATGNRSAGN